MAGGRTLVENSDYTVDYAMGIVTITNQSIIDSGQNVSVTLENQSMFSMQRKTLLGLDLQYKFNKNLTIGGTLLHFSEKALTEKVDIGNETVNNSMFGLNLSYNNEFMWLTNLLNKIPTVNATAPSRISVLAEYARLMPHKQKAGSNKGSSYLDDFEYTQTGIDLRSPYGWFLAPTPYDPGKDALFPEAALSNNVDYGKNRALLNWYYIDRMFTQRNSSLAPGYIKSDLKMLSNPYIREVKVTEIFPGRQQTYGESSVIQTLNLSFYPTERDPTTSTPTISTMRDTCSRPRNAGVASCDAWTTPTSSRAISNMCNSGCLTHSSTPRTPTSRVVTCTSTSVKYLRTSSKTDSKATRTAYPWTAMTNISQRQCGDACQNKTPSPTLSTMPPTHA